jgi:hypothetical protein
MLLITRSCRVHPSSVPTSNTDCFPDTSSAYLDFLQTRTEENTEENFAFKSSEPMQLTRRFKMHLRQLRYPLNNRPRVSRTHDR